MKLGQRIKALREQAKLTQEQLGQHFAGADSDALSKQAISAWEAGRNQPTAAQVAILCRTFRVSADSLLGLSADKPADLSEVVELVRLFAGMDSKSRTRVLDVARFEGMTVTDRVAASNE